MEAEVRGVKMLCCWLDDGGRGHEPRNASSLQILEPGKGQEADSPLETPEGMQALQHFDF